MSRSQQTQALKAYAMLAPALILFATFILAPLALAIVIAFKRVDVGAGLLESPWVGLQNFRDLFGNVIISERIITAFKNTLLFTICFVPINLAFSLVLATIVHSISEKRQGFYRAALYLPGVTSALIFAMIWKWIYDPNSGLLNALLNSFGVNSINWTGDPNWAMWSVIIAALGAGPGGSVLIYLSALGSVPQDALESAHVEGANALQRWWFVTLPHLRPVTLYLLILTTIGSFQVFELVFVLTSGGPAGSSTVIVYEIYDLAFGQGRYGPAGALSLILLVIVGVFAAFQFKFLGGSREEQRAPSAFERALDVFTLPVGRALGAVGDSLEGVAQKFKGRRAFGAPRADSIRRELGAHLFLIPVSFLFFIPMIWMFLSAFTPKEFLIASPPQVSPTNFSLSNYATLVKAAPLLPRWFWNSAYLAFVTTLLQSLLSCLVGYVFARLEFPGRKIIFTLLILSIMLPYQALIIPLFFVVSSGLRSLLHFDLIDTHWAVILPAICSPVGIFLMRQYIQNLPHDLEEAARIDGCGEFAVWYRIVLPLCRPMMAAWAILTFTGAWKNFFWPFVVLGSEELFTLEVGLQTLQQQNAKDFGLVMAGATTSAIPMILIFFIFQKQIVRGLTAGAVKG